MKGLLNSSLDTQIKIPSLTWTLMASSTSWKIRTQWQS